MQKYSEIWDEKKFYVRSCYEEIANIMLQTKPPVMSLLGSSGIGKSNFIIYLIWRRFQEDELKNFPVFLYLKDDIFRLQKGEEPKKADVTTLKSAPEQALYIMDADINEEHGVGCQSLWVTSARRPETASSNTEHFKHAKSCRGQFFMPPWSLEEMLSEKVMDLHQVPKETVEKRFGIFGGTARLVLQPDEKRAEDDEEMLHEAVQSPNALTFLEVPADMKTISKATHLLLKLHPKRNFSSFEVQLSSRYVRQELVLQNWAKRRDALWNRIDEGMISGIGHALFEEAFHQFMQDKSIGNFKLRARRLTADGDKTKETRQEFQGDLHGVLFFGNEALNIEDGKYYQPKSGTFPAFDSWTSAAVFQLTTNQTHEITFGDNAKDLTKTKAYQIVDALSKKEGKAKFFFVVPHYQFDYGWTKTQTVRQPEMADKIEQWVVCFEKKLPE